MSESRTLVRVKTPNRDLFSEDGGDLSGGSFQPILRIVPESEGGKLLSKTSATNCAVEHHILGRQGMSAKSVQFAVAAHIMAALGYRHGQDVSSAILADSVNADPTFVRKSLSKLSKAGLVVTKRGKSGASVLARSPRQITLLDIYRASAAPRAFAIHSYPIEKRCPVSCHLKECMSGLLSQAQNSFERSLRDITLADLVGQIREKAH